MAYTYERKTDRRGAEYIEITGYEGSSRQLTIADTIEGLPVKSIGAGAFRSREELREVRLPESVYTLGRYAFYNCKNLTAIYLHDGVEDYYDGVIKQCENLQEIHLTLHSGNFSVMRDMLADNDRRLRFFLEPMGIQLTFPAYVYDFVEDVEARVLHHKIEGSGYPYRECVTRKGVELLAYDRLFSQVITDDYEAAIEIAFDRLLHPVELERGARELYEQYLEQTAEVVLNELIPNGRQEEITYMCEHCLIPKESLETALCLAADKKQSAVTAQLMEYQRIHFGRQTQTEALSLDEW